MSLNLLSIGDASLDVFLTPVESESFCRLDNQKCLIGFTYGDKIPVKRLEFTMVVMRPIMQLALSVWVLIRRLF